MSLLAGPVALLVAALVLVAVGGYGWLAPRGGLSRGMGLVLVMLGVLTGVELLGMARPGAAWPTLSWLLAMLAVAAMAGYLATLPRRRP